MSSIKCMFCGKITSSHKINVQKKVNGKVVTITNGPVYYCEPCDETFLSKEVLDTFNYIRDYRLDEKRVLFDFVDIYRKVNKE